MDPVAVNFSDIIIRPSADRTCRWFTQLCETLRQYEAQNIETLLGEDDNAIVTEGDVRPTVTVGMVKSQIAAMRTIKSLFVADDNMVQNSFYRNAVNPGV